MKEEFDCEKLGANYFREAAEEGNAEAQCCLGFYYKLGEGEEKDLVESALEKKHIEAMLWISI